MTGSYVIATPEIMTSAATDLSTVGSTLDAAHRAAALTTQGMAPAAADVVSVSIARLFSQHAQEYQAVAGQAAAFREQFVHNLSASAVAFASAEDAIVSLLQGLETGVRSLLIGYESLVAQFIAGSDSWINVVPGPLRAFVVGVPFLSMFVLAFPLAVITFGLDALIKAITG
jgi:hypothetical protein